MATIKIEPKRLETDDDSIESIVDRIRRRRLVKTDDGKFKVVANVKKTDEPKALTAKADSKTDDEQRITKASDLTKQLVLADTGVDDSKKFDLQNFGTTNFPRNTPVYINGPKGSGKTYLLSAVLQYVFKHD